MFCELMSQLMCPWESTGWYNFDCFPALHHQVRNSEKTSGFSVVHEGVQYVQCTCSPLLVEGKIWKMTVYHSLPGDLVLPNWVLIDCIIMICIGLRNQASQTTWNVEMNWDRKKIQELEWFGSWGFWAQLCMLHLWSTSAPFQCHLLSPNNQSSKRNTTKQDLAKSWHFLWSQ